VAAELTVAEVAPEFAFCIGGIVAELPGAFGGTIEALVHAGRMPTPNPSRKREGG
jgi:hypothetical protein